MKIDRKITFSHLHELQEPSCNTYTSKSTPEERISQLEELRYDLGKITGYDYSRRLERSITILKR